MIVYEDDVIRVSHRPHDVWPTYIYIKGLEQGYNSAETEWFENRSEEYWKRQSRLILNEVIIRKEQERIAEEKSRFDWWNTEVWG